jgi:hypothetical protein
MCCISKANEPMICQKLNRQKRGYALVSTMVLGAFSILFLMALASMVNSSVRAVSANKWTESLRNAAEIGIDYAVAQYNNVTPCPLDPLGTATTATTMLPAQYLSTSSANSGAPNIQVTITVTQLTAAADWTALQAMSSTYAAQLDPYQTTAGQTSPAWSTPASALSLNVSGGGFRIVQSTASNGIFQRTIRVILKARLSTPDGQNPLQPAGVNQTSSLFSSPLLSNAALQIMPTNPLTIQGYNSGSQQANTFHTVTPKTGPSYAAYDLNVQTNMQASVGATTTQHATLYGDLTVLSQNSGSNTTAALQNGTVEGRLTTNGNYDQTVTFSNNTPLPSPTDSVQANADVASGPPGSTRQGLNLTQPGLLNAPAVTSTAQTAPIDAPINPTALASLSDVTSPISVSTGGTTFETTGLSTNGVSSPVVLQNASAPAKIYVDDSGTNVAVNLNTNMFVTQNTDARNLQILYPGTDQVNINVTPGGTFTGLIYAPNAAVTISGNGTFNGAIVGSNVNVTMGGTMNIYTDLAATTGNSGKLNAAPGVNLSYMTTSNNKAIVQAWQPITWQEYSQ